MNGDESAQLEGLSKTQTQPTSSGSAPKKKSRQRTSIGSQKRKCVSTACVACRKRKSKCDGALPSCAACASVYSTECIYDPTSDHRRKGVYREKVDSMKARNSTLQVLIEAILNAAEEDVHTIVTKIRTCDSLDVVAEQILRGQVSDGPGPGSDKLDDDDDGEDDTTSLSIEGERELARKMGELRVENGSMRFFGGTSHLIYLGDPNDGLPETNSHDEDSCSDDPMTTWTRVTNDGQLITHLLNMYFNYHYAYFVTLSRDLFWSDFLKGRSSHGRGTNHCSSLLVNAMLALGCHFTDVPGAFAVPGDSRTKGDHFFAEAKRLILENDDFARPRLVTVQALALMSVREAGCAREAKGWVYSGMSFRMAQDIGLNLEISGLDKEHISEHEADARKITFWGCFLFDKCWSNYLGRLPLLPQSSFNVTKFEVFPEEDAEMWSPLTDGGFDRSNQQPARTRAVALQLSALCEISSDLLLFFYHPNHIGRSSGKSVELKKLSELHQRLEEWRKAVPKELEPREGQLPNMILVHMFFHLQYIHLFRPFLKYTPSNSPLPSHISPRRICTANASAISKLMRLYKKSWNLRQICNIAVYMLHSACTIHLLNLPAKTARRDITHGLKHLEEMAEDWLCARRTLSILSVLSRKWKCDLPLDASAVFRRSDANYGSYNSSEVPSPRSNMAESPVMKMEKAAALEDQGNNSPLSQYTKAHMSRDSPSAPQPVGDPTLGTRPMEPVPNPMIDTSVPHPLQPQMFTPSNPGIEPDMLGGWDQAAAAAQAPNFLLGFSPGHPQNLPSGQTNPAGLATMQMVGIDGQDWFINDSARWQQSFGPWSLNTASPNDTVFKFASSGDDAQNAESTKSDSTDRNSGFETLGTALDDCSWLPGLE